MPSRPSTLESISANTVAIRVPPTGLPRVCTSLLAENTAALLEGADKALRHTSLLEFRLDGLKNPASALPSIEEFCRWNPDVQVIATCRRVEAGGLFKGSLEAECTLLLKAAKAGCKWVDLALESAEEVSAKQLNQLRDAAFLIVSYHDYKSTRHLPEAAKRLRAIAASAYKLVPTARDFGDNLTLLNFLEHQIQEGRTPWIGFCMGDAGVPSRVLSLRAGALFTFGSAAQGSETAPGQIDTGRMQKLFRVEQITRATRVYGVLGNPLAHSLSPLMQNTAFQNEGINAVFLPLLAKSLDQVLEGIEPLGVQGFSVTQPYKVDIIEHLDGVDALARKVGAVNTVVRSDGKLFGFNTDVAGIVTPLEHLRPLAGAKVLVLGAGGAARAAVFGLQAKGAQVSIYNRTPPRAQQLAKQAQAQTVKQNQLGKLRFDILINATPVGQTPRTSESPLKPEDVNAAIVFDLVYNPIETTLLKIARGKGAKLLSGLEMFVTQGARQFEIWTGRPAPLAAMRQTVINHFTPSGS